MKIPRARVNGGVRVMSGGPWAGKFVYLPNYGTLVFSVNGFRGRYNGLGEWVGVPRE